MKITQILTAAIAIVVLSASAVFAADTDTLPAKNDVQAAGEAVLDELYNNSFAKEMIPEGSVITLSEGLPCVFSSNLTDEMTFDSIKQAPSGYYFSFYVDGAPGGYAFAQIIDGLFRAASVSYSETEYAVELKSIEYDDVVQLNDWRDEYYLIRKNGDEYVVPGLSRRGPDAPRQVNTRYGLFEWVNAIQYRDEYFPLDPYMCGSEDEDIAWQYVGITESNQLKYVLKIVAIVAGVLAILCVTIFILRRKRKSKMQLRSYSNEDKAPEDYHGTDTL